MSITIQVSIKLKEELNKRKLFAKETYEEVIWDLIEDTKELNEETKKDIENARKEYKQDKYYTHEEVRKRLKI